MLSNFTLHNRFVLLKRIWLRLFIKPFLNKINWLASSFLEKKDILIQFPNASVKVINDGIDIDAFFKKEHVSKIELVNMFTDKKIEKVSNVFFSMGRLHKIKRFDILIDAFALFLKDEKDAKLLIAGDDDGVKPELKEKIQNLNLSNSIFLIGHLNFTEKSIVLNNCDYFTLASDFESFGIVIAEALACGKPIIVSDKTPWLDIEEKQCGIVAENDIDKFYIAFKDIIIFKFNSSKIRKYVKSKCDWEVITKRFIGLIKN